MQEKRVDDFWNFESNTSQTTTRPDHVWPEAWTNISKAAQNRAKQEWKNEKPKLDNARRLRGENLKDPWQRPCRAKVKLKLAPRRWLQGRILHPKRFRKRFTAEKWNLMNPQGKEWNLLYLQNTKMTLQAKVLLR